MSDAMNFHLIYTQQPSQMLNNSIRKQQPASKLINTYLSTAAQYLNRTKSFHIPSKMTLTDNHCLPTVVNNDSPQQIALTNTSDLARSVPSNMHHVSIPALSVPRLVYQEHQVQPGSSEFNLHETTNSSKGLVNTLRRSLKKSKERFYNKRATTMKSCNSLINYEQPASVPALTSITPTLHSRHQYFDQHSGSSVAISMKTIDDHDESDRMPPLQPLGLNGRNRILPNGPFPATSLQSLVPQTANSVVSIPQLTISSEHDEKERLKNDLVQLKNELQKSKETIARLQKSEEQMRERLAEQAQRQLEKGGKFEDLNQVSRPTELIRSYNSLYSQSRIDALDALDSIRELSEADDLKSKLLFSVVVLAFRHAQSQAKDVRNKVKQILQLTNDKTSIVLEETIEKYLRTTIQKYDVGKITLEVENQLWTTLYDYPNLKSCNELLKYINLACRTAWGLVNQTPPYSIEFQITKYDKQIHERFHTSDNESETIVEYVWPCLIDGRDRTCVARGVVLTDERHLPLPKTRPS